MSITTKISLYDMLSMVLPGGLLLWCVKQMNFADNIINQFMGSLNDFPGGILWLSVFVIILAYIVGLINHVLTDSLFSKVLRLRNKPEHIFEVCSELKLKGEWIALDQLKLDQGDKNQVVDRYYMAYAYSTMHKCDASINIVEKQIAMLENFLLPILIAVFMLGKMVCQADCLECGCTFVGSCILIDIVIAVTFILIIIQRMKKVYQMVLENFEYYNRLGNAF